MRYPKLTVFLVLIALLILWGLISGIEPDRAVAELKPLSSTPGEGAVFVIGGTRATGLEVVKILRERGDEVVVLAREGSDTSEVEATGARVVRGDAMNLDDLRAAMADGNYRVVISTLGSRQSQNPRPDFIGNRNAVDAAREAGIRRFVLVTVIGAGDSENAAPWIAKQLLKDVMREKSQAEDYLRTSGLDYTIIRPGGLLPKEPQHRVYLTEDTGAMSWIRRTDLAWLTVRAADDPQTIGRVYHAHDPDRTRFWSIPTN